MVKTTKRFENVVGQDEPKKVLGFYLNAYDHTRIMPNIIFTAQKGDGKSLLARETAKQLIAYGEDGKPLMKEDGKTPKKKTFHEINAAVIGTARQFVNGVLVPKVVDKHCTVFIDEAHKLKGDVTNLLLTLLNPNEANRNTITHDDYTCEVDFRMQTFILATTETHAIFGPLMDRLKRIELQTYTPEHLAQIVQISSPEVSYKDGVLEKISSVVRCNARQAVSMASDIRTYLCGKTAFGNKQWKELSNILSIKPLGLTQKEIDILQFMLERPDGSSLTNLAARSGLSREAIQKDYEAYLQHCGFMEINPGKGRQITPKGQEYLKALYA